MNYYLSQVKFATEQDNGRIRNIKENYLVEAESVGDAEEKLKEKFKNTMAEFSVVSVKEANIMGIVK